MPLETQAHTLSLQRDHSPLPEVDTSLFNPSFQLESPIQESPFNVADLIAGLPSHVDPSLNSHHSVSVGPLEGLSPHDTHTLGPFPDAMDWLTPAASEAYSEAPTPYEYDYEGTPPFARDDPSLFTHARSEGDSGSPYTPPNGNPPLPSHSHFDNASIQPVAVLHQPKPTTPTASAFSDMWKDVGGDVYGGLNIGGGDGYSAEEAFDTLFEFDAGYGVGGEGGGYEYEGMGMVG